jgi:hypothetical protein
MYDVNGEMGNVDGAEAAPPYSMLITPATIYHTSNHHSKPTIIRPITAQNSTSKTTSNIIRHISSISIRKTTPAIIDNIINMINNIISDIVSISKIMSVNVSIRLNVILNSTYKHDVENAYKNS